jgi:hypothetical protein
MKRIAIKIMLIITSMTFIYCPAFFALNKKESKFYTPEETIILEKTTKALEYDFAYDPDINLDYIFEFSRTKKDIPKNEKEFSKVIDTIKTDSLISFYEKIYSLKIQTLIKLEEYKIDESVKYITYLEKYILPPLNSYFSVLEKYVVIRDNNYSKSLPARKKFLLKRTLLQLQKENADKEFDESYYN